MIFGIDFGLKRIGMAKVLNNIIVPMPPILRKNRSQASLEFKKILLQHSDLNNTDQIKLIFGLSCVDKNDEIIESKRDEMQRRIKHFLGLIDFEGDVIYIDESYSSIQAQDMLKDRNYQNRLKYRKNGVIDSISACIILERYLESIGIYNKRI